MRNDDWGNPLIVDEIPGLGEYIEALAGLPAWAYPGRQICSQCGGDGWLVSTGEPGIYFSELENYFPSEDVVLCPECRGKGWVEVDEGQ